MKSVRPASGSVFNGYEPSFFVTSLLVHSYLYTKSLYRCTECEVDNIWEDQVPDIEASAKKRGVTAKLLSATHVDGYEEDIPVEDQRFDPDMAFYSCLEQCCDNRKFCTGKMPRY